METELQRTSRNWFAGKGEGKEEKGQERLSAEFPDHPADGATGTSPCLPAQGACVPGEGRDLPSFFILTSFIGWLLARLLAWFF